MPQTDSPATRILVVEDDEAIRSTLADILELNGYSVHQAGDGREGLEAALAKSPDMILADIAMPRMDGLAMIDALHADERTRAIPIIIVSASVEIERMREGMDRGAEDFLVKPFTEDQVIRSIKARLEKKALLDELDAFAHTVAHDLKNPIASMMARATLMRLTWKPPRVRLGAERVPERDCVRFWVEDNGDGIEPAKQGQLFRQFSRLGETGVDGHGLGLSIVRRITEKLGGAAGCESEVGHGSRFWFELPAVEGANPER